MTDASFDFQLRFHTPDELSVQRVNAVLAAQRYSLLSITEVKPSAVSRTRYRPDGTVQSVQRSCGLYGISFSGETDDSNAGYEYRLHMSFVAREEDRGADSFREHWTRLHLYSTMRQMIQYEFQDGYVYIVLCHDGEPQEADPVELSMEEMERKPEKAEKRFLHPWRRGRERYRR